MNSPYKNIFSPLKIGNKVLKNRILQSKCALIYDTAEDAAEFYLRMSNAGLATVVVGGNLYSGRSLSPGVTDGIASHIKKIDMLDPHTRQVFSDMIIKMHKNSTLVSYSLMGIEPMDVSISHVDNWEDIPMTGDYFNVKNLPEISLARLEEMIEEFVWRCKDVYSLGFDMVTVYMSYRASILARSISPLLNTRKDKYGGKTMTERAALSLELFRRIKDACPGMLIEVQISGEEEIPGYTADDWLEYCKACEGVVDIFQVRGFDGSATHVNGYNMEQHMPPNLKFAKLFKDAGIKALISPVGGFGDPDDIERFISEKYTDCVSMARAFIADSEYLHKLENNRPEDIIPCIMCNRCHGEHKCSVNPAYANRKVSYSKASVHKKVAVIGGGIAGMQAALTAASRGHSVTLYEKNHVLGGQLKFADYVSFKWPIKEYRDRVIEKVLHSNISVKLGTEASPEMIKGEKYDAVICALGSTAKSIPVKGADAEYVWLADKVYGHQDELGENIAVVGGGMAGRETALYLAECGHKVTLITRKQASLFSDMHAQRAEEDFAKNLSNFSYLEHASIKEIGFGFLVCDIKHGIPHVELGFNGGIIPGHVHDVDGRKTKIAVFDESNVTLETRRIKFDNVIVSGGRIPNIKLSEAFKNSAPEVYVIGDNDHPGDIRDCNITAYDVAMRL